MSNTGRMKADLARHDRYYAEEESEPDVDQVIDQALDNINTLQVPALRRSSRSPTREKDQFINESNASDTFPNPHGSDEGEGEEYHDQEEEDEDDEEAAEDDQEEEENVPPRKKAEKVKANSKSISSVSYH